MRRHQITPSRSTRLLRFAVTTSLIGIAATSTPALAQDAKTAADSSDQGITDIVVTAQRREQNVQKTALSIEVFSGDDLRAAGVMKADDLGKLARHPDRRRHDSTDIHPRRRRLRRDGHRKSGCRH